MAPKEIHYRDYKTFNVDGFKTELRPNLSTSSINHKSFEQPLLALLDKHVLYKRKRIRANQFPHMTKSLRKAILKIFQLKTNYLKTNIAESFIQELYTNIQETKQFLY